MMKNIVLINQCSGYLMLDIVNAFAKYYDKTVLLTGEINIRPTIPDEKVVVHKLKQYNRSSLVSRCFSWVIAFLQILFIIRRKYKKYHVFLVSNPPLTIFLPLLIPNEYSFLIYDIYPDTLVAQKYIKSCGSVDEIWKKTNKKVLNKAKNIFTISKDMQLRLAQYIELKRITIIYNWAHNEHLIPVEKKDNFFADKYHLEDKFIVMYSGNMGATHQLETILHVAKALENDDDFYFLFIGEGLQKNALEVLAKQYELRNILFLPFQPTDTLPFSMGVADVGLVTMDINSAALSIPSKLYSWLAVGASILSLAKSDSELATFVDENGIGINFYPDQTERIVDYLIHLKQHPAILNKMKRKARELSANFSPSNSELFVQTVSAST